jgi:hypothetical protein
VVEENAYPDGFALFPEQGSDMGRLGALGQAISSPPVNLNHPGHYLQWGVIQISVANLVVVVAMVVVFVAALLLPFPKGRR